MSDTPTTPTKEDEKTKTTNVLNAKKFEGEGISFKAKLIGMEELSVDRDEKVCLDSMFKLKAVARARGEHKQKIQLNLTINAVKVMDEITKSKIVSHEIDKISFVVIDPRDNRAFGYIYNTSDNRHQFWAIKTERAAAATVLGLKELFELAFEQFALAEKNKAAANQPVASSTPQSESTSPEQVQNTVTSIPKVENPPEPSREKMIVPDPSVSLVGWDDPIDSSLSFAQTTNQPANNTSPSLIQSSSSVVTSNRSNLENLFNDSSQSVPPAATSGESDLFDLFSNSTPTVIQPAVSPPGNVSIQPTFTNFNPVVQPQTQIFPNSTPISPKSPNLSSPTSPVAPATLTNPLHDLDIFNGLTIGSTTTRTTKDAFFPSTGPARTIQQMQMERQS